MRYPNRLWIARASLSVVMLLAMRNNYFCAAPPAPAVATKLSEADSPVLKRILASWKTRQDRVKAFHATIISRESAGMPRQMNTYKLEYWAQGLDVARRDRTLVSSTSKASRAINTMSIRIVADGLSTSIVRYEQRPDRNPASSVDVREDRKGDGRAAMLGYLHPLDLAFRAHASGVQPMFRPDKLRIVEEKAVADGRPCFKLEDRSNERRPVSVWVDPQRDDVIVKVEEGGAEYAATIRYGRDDARGWVPSGWTIRNGRVESEGSLTSLTVSEAFPADVFSPTFGPGAVVLDYPNKEQYVVADDGSKTDVIRTESQSALRILQTLSLQSDFEIPLQPISDAIEFLKARYEIPIVIDAQGLARGGAAALKTEIAVRDPMKVRALLDLLARRLSMGYRIEDEVLKLSPRFAGSKELTAPPRPLPATPNAIAGNRLRAALKATVDFELSQQPLKDAVDFMKTRYEIDIATDDNTLAKAGIDANFDVLANFPGITLHSLLHLLMEQMPKPVELKVEGETLRIVPARAARP